MGLFNFLRFPSHDMAIDLGTANTVVYVRGRGVVLNEPSVVAIETIGGVKRVKAVGDDAKLMMGKTPDQSKPSVRSGRRDRRHRCRRADDQAFIQKVHASVAPALARDRDLRPSVRRRSKGAIAAASNAGARQVWLIEEPMAAAIGADMPVTEPIGSMVVDIGGGTTEVACACAASPTPLRYAWAATR